MATNLESRNSFETETKADTIRNTRNNLGGLNKDILRGAGPILRNREKWKQTIRNIDSQSKEKIIQAAKKIPLKYVEYKDKTKSVEFKLWNKTYKIMEPNLENHSDSKYYVKGVDGVDEEWMKWNVNEWKNGKLSEYVKQKWKEWLRIPTIEEINNLLWELWKFTWLDNEKDEMAMLMYLTGLGWQYRTRESNSVRSDLIVLNNHHRWINNDRHDSYVSKLFFLATK